MDRFSYISAPHSKGKDSHSRGDKKLSIGGHHHGHHGHHHGGGFKGGGYWGYPMFYPDWSPLLSDPILNSPLIVEKKPDAANEDSAEKNNRVEQEDSATQASSSAPSSKSSSDKKGNGTLYIFGAALALLVGYALVKNTPE